MPPTRIHILGASGSGTTTLGKALAAKFQCAHIDTDSYYWVQTDPPFQTIRPREAMRYGPAAIAAGGFLHKQHCEFIEWASAYDGGGLNMRSRQLHETWLAKLDCPVILLEGEMTTAAQLKTVERHLANAC